jgi:Putative adhesin
MTATQDATLLLDHPIGRRGRVGIRLPAAEIRIVAEDGERVTVRALDGRSLPDRVILETTDGGLTIREQEMPGIGFGSGRRTIALELGVPAEAEVTVDTASGSVVSEGLHGIQRYRTASGDLHAEDAAGRIDVNAVSGDVFLQLVGSAELRVRTVSGDLRVEGGSLAAARLQTTSGDIWLDSPLMGNVAHAIETLSGDVSIVAPDGLRVEARTVSGDLTSEIPHRTEGRAGRRVIVIGDGSVELAFRSVSGDLQIHAGSTDRPAAPVPPTPARPPSPPAPPVAPVPPRPDDTTADPDAEERLDVLRALERGELDVATAMDRLAELDARSPGSDDA